MTKTKRKIYDIRKLPFKEFRWLPAFIGPSLAFVLFAGLYLLVKTPMNFAVAMPLTAGLGGIGFAGFLFTLQKSKKIRLKAILGIVVLTTVVAVSLPLIFNQIQKGLLTCEVCGYRSLYDAEDACPVCFIPLTEDFRIEGGYDSREEMVKIEQIMFFMPVTGKSEINFRGPELSPEGFAKDQNWKEVTTLQEVLEVQALLPDSLQ